MLPSGGVHFRVWASQRQHVEVILEGGPGHHPGVEPISIALEPEGDGYFSGLVSEASVGTLYRYRLDGGTESYLWHPRVPAKAKRGSRRGGGKSYVGP